MWPCPGRVPATFDARTAPALQGGSGLRPVAGACRLAVSVLCAWLSLGLPRAWADETPSTPEATSPELADEPLDPDDEPLELADEPLDLDDEPLEPEAASDPNGDPDALELAPVQVRRHRLHQEDRQEPTSFATTYAAAGRSGLGEHVGDVLARSPGVQVRSLGGELGPRTVQLRGGSAQQVLVELEGVRLNGLGDGSADLSLVPLAALQTVSVMRGGGAVSRGSGAEAGVVSLALARGDQGAPLVTTLSGGGGTLETLRGEVAATGSPASAWTLGGGLTALHTGGRFAFVDDQGTAQHRENNDGDQVGAFAVAAREGRDLDVRLASLVSATERGAPGPSEFPGRFAEARLEDTLWVSAAQAHGEAWEADGVLLTWRAAVGHRWSARRYRNPTALLGGAAFSSDGDEQLVQPSVEATLLAGEGSTTTLRAETAWERLDRTVGERRGSFDRATWSGTALQEVSLWRDLLLLGAGLRVEHDGVDATWVPRAGATLRPAAGWMFQANVSRAYRRATFDELYSQLEFVRGDPTLGPEDAVTADLGLRVGDADDWLEAVAFVTDYDALILFVPTSAHIWQARNLSGAVSRGLEISGGVRPLPELFVELGYTYLDAAMEAAPHYPLPGRARHGGRALVAVETHGVRVELEGRAVGARTLDMFGLRLEPAVLWLDASITWELGERWMLAGKVSNLLDVDWAVDALQQPLPGLTAFASLTWRQPWLP